MALSSDLSETNGGSVNHKSWIKWGVIKPIHTLNISFYVKIYNVHFLTLPAPVFVYFLFLAKVLLFSVRC